MDAPPDIIPSIRRDQIPTTLRTTVLELDSAILLLFPWHIFEQRDIAIFPFPSDERLLLRLFSSINSRGRENRDSSLVSLVRERVRVKNRGRRRRISQSLAPAMTNLTIFFARVAP